MKHAQHNSRIIKVGQRYLMPSGAVARVTHLRGDSEVGLEYEKRRYKGRAEQVAMSTSNVKNICKYIGEGDEEESYIYRV